MTKLIKTSLLLSLLWCSFLFANQFTGTWQLVSGEYVNHEGQLINYESLKMESIKVITDKHFSFISHSDGKFWASGAGQYTYSDQEYTEIPRLTSFEIPATSRYQFTYEIDGNLWKNSRYENGKRVEFELWKKIE